MKTSARLSLIASIVAVVASIAAAPASADTALHVTTPFCDEIVGGLSSATLECSFSYSGGTAPYTLSYGGNVGTYNVTDWGGTVDLYAHCSVGSTAYFTVTVTDANAATATASTSTPCTRDAP